MKKKPNSSTENPDAISSETRARLQAVAAFPEADVDGTDPDAPEVLDWSASERGRFYRPVKVQKTLRIDADVVAFFEAAGPGHLTRMNRVLRESMLQALRQARRTR